MPALTLSERVETLRQEVAVVREALVREEATATLARQAAFGTLSDLRSSCDKASDKAVEVEKRQYELLARLASIEERIKALEKGTDRRWQLAPVLIAAVSAITAIISLVVAIRK